MGIYLNPSNINFQQAINSKIYVDKTMLIRYANDMVCTEQKYICVSRPRRFGKSMAANMLTAYYSRGCDSKEMFGNLKASELESFEKHLNKYNVIHINMVDFLTETENMEEMISFIQEDISEELFDEFSDITFPKRKGFIRLFETIFNKTGIPFVFIIDEWDCIFRVHKNDVESQTAYLNFLRNLLKDKSYVALAYMTGILPIKKYGEHSALNIFYEFSMTDAAPITEFTGFTEDEVKELCEKYNKSYEETKRWYDGYSINKISIYNPKSVVESIIRGQFNNYWTSTETYDALKVYIRMNFDGLKDKITQLVAGEQIKINTTKFQNDMTTFNSADDILTLLVHLGYLTYDFYSKTVRIPNSEVAQEFINSIEDGGWEEVVKAIRNSDELLKATINQDEEKVAALIEQAHSENTSILKYNDENSLSCVISLAYYSARKDYIMYREMPSGKGFADIVFIPRRNTDTPALIIELKYNQSSESAIKQIKEKNYIDCLKDYSGEVMLVGISYDKDASKKHHTCLIEKIVK